MKEKGGGGVLKAMLTEAPVVLYHVVFKREGYESQNLVKRGEWSWSAKHTKTSTLRLFTLSPFSPQGGFRPFRVPACPFIGS